MSEQLIIAGKKRTCSYCLTYHETVPEFTEHYDNCEARIHHGYIMHKSVREAFMKCAAAVNAAKVKHHDTWTRLEDLIKQRDDGTKGTTREQRKELEKKIEAARTPDGQAWMDLEEVCQDFRTLVKYFGKPDFVTIDPDPEE